jgi:YVTN family beta-propeller protein
MTGVAAAVFLGLCAFRLSGPRVQMGKQSDGSYIVSSGQRIQAGTIAFPGRPSDLAVRPGDSVFAVMKKDSVFLCRPDGIIPDSTVDLGAEPGFHGLIWTPDGHRLIASTAKGTLMTFDYDGQKLTKGAEISLVPVSKNPVPGGMCIAKDGKTLFVAAADLNAVVQVDLETNQAVRFFHTANLPFTVRLSPDESELVVSDWGGRVATETDHTSKSEDMDVVVDDRGIPNTGVVSLIDRASGNSTEIAVGVHPTDIAVSGDKAYVANAMSDTVSVIDLQTKKLDGSIALRWGALKILGAMPSALAVAGDRLLVANGGDNAVAEVDLKTRKVLGYRAAGYWPIALAIDGDRLLALNSKGNGSVARTGHGMIGNVHDFEGTVSVIDRSVDLGADTQKVADNNYWGRDIPKPSLAVYNGAIKHVLYIIKENRTYDEIFGDMPEGNGDAKLADIGATLAPNHQAIARAFTLFDNAYVSGTNSADGHAWSTQSVANDYLEHFYVGYSRTYSDDGNCSMSLNSGGCIWDAAAKKHLSIRDYGEFCVANIAEYHPYQPHNWFEAWKDRQEGGHKFTFTPHTQVAGLKPYVAPGVHYWPLLQSDQSRADAFIAEYQKFSREDKIPNLTILSLPCDHTEGTNPVYPAPKSMIADNDLALGRVVEAVSHSPQWKNTCIYVIEDDAQSGPDHVDGHRTSYMVISPYNKRHTVDSNLYTTTNMLRSIEMMLGIDPMNRFDGLSKPIDTCFSDTLDLTPYDAVPNRIALDLKNPGADAATMTPQDKYWLAKNQSLDWSFLDAPDPYWLNRIIWASLHKDGTPYPARDGEAPGQDTE